MKVAFISDIHSNLEALKKVLEEIEKMKIGNIFCIGDICGYGPNPSRCVEIIKKLKIPCVKGNHDYAVLTKDTSWFNPYAAAAIEWQTEQLDEDKKTFLEKLPEKIVTTLGNIRFYLVHGSPRNPIWEYVYEEDIKEEFVKNLSCDVLVMGHTHIPFIKRFGDCFVINSGSVGQPRDGINKASFVMFDTRQLEAKIIRVEYNIKVVAERVIKVGLPVFLAQRLFLGV
jgi:putative phosphoesterase